MKKINSNILIVLGIISMLTVIAGRIIENSDNHTAGIIVSIIGAILFFTVMVVGFFTASNHSMKVVFLSFGLMMGGIFLIMRPPMINLFIGAVLFFAGIISSLFIGKKKSTKKMNKSTVATLVNMRETGVYQGRARRAVEVELTYEFYTDRGIKVTAAECMFLGAVNLSQLHIGAQLPIRYQEDKPDNAAYDSEANTRNQYTNYQRY